MLIVMKDDATEEQIDAVISTVTGLGFAPERVPGVQRSAICVLGNKSRVDATRFENMAGIQEIIHVSKPYKLVSREGKDSSVIAVGDVRFGGGSIPVIAGPCAVEDRPRFLEIAGILKTAGASMLRGGAFKPRTSPYAFQGLKEEGLKIMAEARELTGLPICTEVMDTDYVDMVSDYADVVQVGARNMQNFSLLRRVGRQAKPVLLKRGLAATITEFLMAAEYIISEGNWNVILCERGIRTFEGQTRNTLDVSAIPVIHELSHLPVVVDPSHASGRAGWVTPLARGAVAVGADGLMIEVHQNPTAAFSDGAQSLTPEQFERLMAEAKLIAGTLGRTI